MCVGIYWRYLNEKSVGATELHYSIKKREHSFSILKALFDLIQRIVLSRQRD